MRDLWKFQTIDFVIRTNSLITQKRPIVTLAQRHWNYWTNQRIWVTWNWIDRENPNLSISAVILISNQHKFVQYVATYILRARISHNRLCNWWWYIPSACTIATMINETYNDVLIAFENKSQSIAKLVITYFLRFIKVTIIHTIVNISLIFLINKPQPYTQQIISYYLLW